MRRFCYDRISLVREAGYMLLQGIDNLEARLRYLSNNVAMRNLSFALSVSFQMGCGPIFSWNLRVNFKVPIRKTFY